MNEESSVTAADGKNYLTKPCSKRSKPKSNADQRND